ncbi:uncharacterized protein LOC120216453 [Hibiscus syriacus]|uniref:uncharacterized protein LOC120216453 n=1 Tax=Hibiscus syriacus TaxID=106335 RepID=UPI0019217218|nr:uncharacterized protein LOC120216453 [Hibiscus syriacus]
MVKAVVGEESKLQLAELRLSQSSASAQVGLVIGNLSSCLDRGFVYGLLPTPQNDAGQPVCLVLEPATENRKKGSKPKSQSSDSSSSLVIDKDWVAEHARQVSRMMVGGIGVVGNYVWASEAAFKNSILLLCQTVKGVAEAASLLEDDLDERLLIHICYSPRRYLPKEMGMGNCTLSSNITSSSLRPCDFKMGRVLTVEEYLVPENLKIGGKIMADSSPNSSPTILPFNTMIHMVTIKLSSSKYLLWKSQLLPLLESQGLLGHVDGTLMPPPLFDPPTSQTPNNKYMAWKATDQRVLSLLLSSLTEEAMAEAVGLSISREVWTALENTFSHRSKARELRLKDDLQLMKRGTRFVTAYARAFKTLCDQLHAIGRPVDGTDKVHWFLRGLGPEFSSFFTAQMAQTPSPVFLILCLKQRVLKIFKNL